MPLPETRRLSGTTLLRSVREDLAPYRETLESRGRQVAILRFGAAQDDPPVRRLRMEAARISAEQKVKTFSGLGLGVDHRVLSPSVPAVEFAGLLTAFNADRDTVAIIVQFPPPPRLTPLVQQLAPAKDIDGLLGERSQQRACATADGIVRMVLPFAGDGPDIAVVGARGFVGRGVVRLLGDRGLTRCPVASVRLRWPCSWSVSSDRKSTRIWPPGRCRRCRTRCAVKWPQDQAPWASAARSARLALRRRRLPTNTADNCRDPGVAVEGRFDDRPRRTRRRVDGSGRNPWTLESGARQLGA
jgi:hypothetical protein